MTITELINYFRTGGNKDEFFKKNSLDKKSEVIEIYMQKPFKIENEIKLLAIEKTKGNSKYVLEDIEYQNLIDFYHFTDFIAESKTCEYKDLTDKELAEIFLNYCINDA